MIEPGYREERPWGAFVVLHDSIEFKVKILEVKPGARLSYQSHQQREENWVVTQGTATVVLNDQEHTVQRGEAIFIAQGARHRLWNKTDSLIKVVETQTGDYFGEDDIQRFEDDYQRAN